MTRTATTAMLSSSIYTLLLIIFTTVTCAVTVVSAEEEASRAISFSQQQHYQEPQGQDKKKRLLQQQQQQQSATSTTTNRVRSLEDYNANSYFPYDLSQFSVKFEKCQTVKSYDDELAEDEDSDTVLAARNFVVYRLCGTVSCEENACDDETLPHGMYVVDIQTYMESTVQNQRRVMEYMCENCQEAYDNDDGGYVECTTECCQTCYEYNNLENNGYLDASEYVNCERVDIDNDDGDDDDNGGDDDGDEFELFVGPKCSSDGSSIMIGLFTDEDCYEPYNGYDYDLETVLGYPLSYMLLKHTTSASITGDGNGALCLSCKEQDDNENENDQNDLDDINEMCEDLYEEAAKCESKNGIEYGFIQTAKDNEEYENQVENEFMACTFIESLVWNSYTETGEINIADPQDEILREVTQVQAVALSVLAVVTAALFGGMWWYQRKIDNVTPKVPLAIKPGHSLT